MEGSNSSPQEKRIAVVTGGNKGIGFGICRQLASNGIRVILTARDEKRGTEAVEKLRESGLSDVVFHQLDVTDSSSIASLADFIKTQYGKLDILVNNAAISGRTPGIERSKASKLEDEEVVRGDDLANLWIRSGIQETFEMAEQCLKTNYLGTKDVTQALVPILQFSDSGRIVNVSSSRGKLKDIPNEKLKQELSSADGITEERLSEILTSFLKDFKEGLLEANGWPRPGSAYRLSKVLVNAYTRILARRYPNMQINCVHPGFVKTDLTWNHGALTVEEGAKGPLILALMTGRRYSGLFFDRTEVSDF